MPLELHKKLMQGFTLCVRVTPSKPVESSIKREASTPEVKIPEEIGPMAIYPNEFNPRALELFKQGFTLQICIIGRARISVVAEKKLS